MTHVGRRSLRPASVVCRPGPVHRAGAQPFCPHSGRAIMLKFIGGTIGIIFIIGLLVVVGLLALIF